MSGRPGVKVGGWALTFVLSMALAGCDPGFDPRTLVTGLRILAVQAEPAEVEPGQDMTMRALVAYPGQSDSGLVYGFIACTPSESGCIESEEALVAADGDEAQAEVEYQKTSVRVGAGLVSNGLLVATGANLTTPSTILEGAADPIEGRNYQVQFFACDAEACLDGDSVSGGVDAIDDLPPEVSVLGIKRGRVSLSEVPNSNPTVESLELVNDGGDIISVLNGGKLSVGGGQIVTLSAVLPQGTSETYSFINDDGESEERVERMYVGWYSTAGEFSEATTLVDADSSTSEERSQVEFELPAQTDLNGESVGVYVVVWDRRGGIGWLTADLEIEP